MQYCYFATIFQKQIFCLQVTHKNQRRDEQSGFLDIKSELNKTAQGQQCLGEVFCK